MPAAHTVASDTAATLNEIAMLNMLILRAQSADIIFNACIAASGFGALDLIAQGLRAAAEIASGVDAIVGGLRLEAVGSDGIRLAKFIYYYTKTSISEIHKVTDKCKDRQKYLYKHFGGTIETHLDYISRKD